MCFNEKDNKAARVLHFRSRLAYLTGEPITPTGQGWETEIRDMSRQLQHALQDAADYIFSGGMLLTEDWKNVNNVNALLWSTTCQLSHRSANNNIFPIHFLMYRNNGRWKINECQLEAALGLWCWSLKQLPKNSQMYTRKVMFVEGSKKMEFQSAIRLWVAQADTINERIQLLSPKSLDPSDPFTKSDHHTDPSIMLDILDWQDDETDEGSGDGVLALQSRSSPLQMIAQDIFTIFIARIADIIERLKDAVPRQSPFAATNPPGNSQERPYLGLMNTHVESITDMIVAAGIATRQDALMSIIPPLLQRSKLPQLDSVIEDLLSYARSLRRECRFQVGEDLLKGLFYLGPSQYQERVTRALGELYRAGIRSQNQQEQNFGTRGFEEMKNVCGKSKLSANMKVILDDYKSVWQFFKERGSPQDLEGNIEDHLKNLPKELTRTRALTLTKEINLSKATLADLSYIIRWAIGRNSPELIEDLWAIKKHLINEADMYGRTPIFWAIEIGCGADTFRALLEWPNVRPDAHDKEGKTPLLLAAEKGCYEAVDALLKQGVDSLAHDKEGSTALILAAENGKDEIAKRLLDAKIDVNILSGNYGSALAVAAYWGRTEVVKFLVQEGKTDVNMQLQSGVYGSALAAAAAYWEGIETVKFLVQEGKADVNMQLQSGDYGSALAAAAFLGRVETVKFLVQEGKADVDMQLQSGDYGSALTAAVYRRRTKIVKFLVQEGKAHVDMQLQYGNYGSALAAAVYMGETEIVKFLVQEVKADVNMQSVNYGSVLAIAAYLGRKECVKILIDAGAVVGLKLVNGRFSSALQAAGAAISKQDLDRLVWYGGDKEAQGREKDEVRALLEHHLETSA